MSKKSSSETTLAGKILDADIGKVRPNTYNYNKQSRFVYEKTKDSLKTFGFVDPIITRSGNDDGDFGYYEVIGGEHRLHAAEDLGYEHVPILDLGTVSDTRAKSLCIVLNETKGKADPDALAALIADISEAGVEDAIAVLPYDEAEIDAFIESVSSTFDDDADSGEDIEIPEDTTADTHKDKRSIIGVMGLIEISKKKEDYLIAKFENALELTGCEGKPIRCLEKMLELVDEAYGPES